MLFSSYWTWNAMTSYLVILQAIDMENFYREILLINQIEIFTITWDEIIRRFITLHENGKYRIAVKEKLTEHEIVLRIMRKENYLIAFINKKLLNLHVPWWASYFFNERRLFLTKSLEWSLSFCVLEYLFTEEFTISLDFMRNKEELERRFFVVGVIHFALLPFMLIFMSIHFILQNAQQFHYNRAYLGPRQWSPLALWTFREFNELPHLFDERMNKAYLPAMKYLNLFHNPYTAVIARFSSNISGAFIAVLLIISIMNEGILLNVHIAEHNLLWYLGVFTATFAASRSMIPDETARASASTPEETLESVASFTHHYPLHWTGKAHTLAVKDEFQDLFPYKAQLFGMEVLSVLLTPMVLCFSLPNSVDSIISFVKQHSKYVDGVGAVCDYSTFDLVKYGDPRFGAVTEGSVDAAHRPAEGKLEQSYLNFRLANPRWEGDETGRAMEEKLHFYRLGKESDREAQLVASLQRSLNSSSFFPPSISALSHHDDDHRGADDFQTRPPATGLFGPRRQGYAPVVSSIPEGEENPILSDDFRPQRRTEIPMLALDKPSVRQGIWRGVSPVRQTSGNISDSQFPLDSTVFSNASVASYLQQSRRNELPKALQSVLQREKIDYENDFYWMTQFRKDRLNDPASFERSCMNSRLLFSGVDMSSVQGPGGHPFDLSDTLRRSERDIKLDSPRIMTEAHEDSFGIKPFESV